MSQPEEQPKVDENIIEPEVNLNANPEGGAEITSALDGGSEPLAEGENNGENGELNENGEPKETSEVVKEKIEHGLEVTGEYLFLLLYK